MSDTGDQELQEDVAQLGRKAQPDEVDDVRRATAIEREWWGHIPAFADGQAIMQAVHAGNLKLVVASDAYLPILRYRNPDLRDTYPPFLEPHTHALLQRIGQEWRRRADESAIDPDAHLALTGLATTTAYQKTLVAAGKLAIEGNPHSRGVAFDFDATGYYLGETPINHRPADKSKYAAAFAESGHQLDAPDYVADQSAFDPRVHTILRQVLEEYQASGHLHYILEYPGTYYSAFHICRNPSSPALGDGEQAK